MSATRRCRRSPVPSRGSGSAGRRPRSCGRPGPEDHLVAMASGRLVDDACHFQPVDRDEAVEVRMVAQQRPHTAQVAELLLADRPTHTIADRLDAVGAHRAQQRQDHGETARIVADAGSMQRSVGLFHVDVRAFGKPLSRCDTTASSGRGRRPRATRSRCLPRRSPHRRGRARETAAGNTRRGVAP